ICAYRMGADGLKECALMANTPKLKSSPHTSDGNYLEQQVGTALAMAALAKFIAILSGAIFTGAALYISLVEHPARMAAGSGVALSQFRQMYPRAAPLQASAAGICGLAGVIAALMSRQVGWLIGGLMVASA